MTDRPPDTDLADSMSVDAAGGPDDERVHGLELFRRLFRQSPIGVAVVGPEGRPLAVNPALCDLLGYGDAELRSMPFSEFTHPEDVEADVEQYRRLMAGEIEDYELDKRFVTAEGDVVRGRLAVAAIRDPEGEIRRAVAFVQDVTEERRAREALRESERRYRSLFESSRDAVYLTTAGGEIVEMNRAGREMFGYEEGELEGRDVRELYAEPEDRERFRAAVREGGGSVKDFELRLRRRDGEVLRCLLTSTARTDADGEVIGFQGIIRDVTEQKRLEAELEHRALHDWLTDLPNRALLRDRLEKALARSDRHGDTVALLFVDLDGFKRVNDRWSHAAGDEVLLQVARRLSAQFREEDTVARMGGDEFVVLLERLEDAGDVERAAGRVSEAFARPFEVEGERIEIDASVGVATRGLGEGREATDQGELLHAADQAMYRAKEEPGTRWRWPGGEGRGGAAPSV